MVDIIVVFDVAGVIMKLGDLGRVVEGKSWQISCMETQANKHCFN